MAPDCGSSPTTPSVTEISQNRPSITPRTRMVTTVGRTGNTIASLLAMQPFLELAPVALDRNLPGLRRACPAVAGIFGSRENVPVVHARACDLALERSEVAARQLQARHLD